jgi:NAD(P)H-nitrite reductase large subunit
MGASIRPDPLVALLQRVREEYREMPNLRLTPSQATRLFGVEPSECAALLDALVNEHFLTRTADGLFVRTAAQ